MKWVYRENGTEKSVIWDAGELITNSPAIQTQIFFLMKNKVEVSCGLLGPFRTAGLDDAIVAWGTVDTALARMADGGVAIEVLDAPDMPVQPEAEMVGLPIEKASFVDRVAEALSHRRRSAP